jgi:uncharacterized membrane protein YeaQ/YmgE (transglycosylase-associated protein family)
MSITLPGIDIPSHTIDFGGLATNDFLVLLVVGVIAGLLASRIIGGTGRGVLVDIVIGVIGAIVGHWLFGLLNINLGPGVLPMIIVAFVGAAILLVLWAGLSGGFARGGARRAS